MSASINDVTSPDMASTRNPTESTERGRIVVAAGFAVGALLGMGGNFLPAGPAQATAYGISSLGLILGSVLFAARFARQGRDVVAAGFAVFALAEAILISQGMAGDAGRAAFATGVAIYALALPLVSLPAALPIWARLAGGLAAVPFAAHALLHWLGRAPDPAGPLASVGYVLLTVAVVGWIVRALRAPAAAPR